MLLLFTCLCLTDLDGSKLPLTKGWSESASLPSKYAVQAAAADDDHVYAISDTHVAQYHRRTRKLTGLATAPDARHLNSAFLWKGKLYCAHSNYPRMPEESDIRVYDPKENTLQLHHKFERPPGSLVWCVRDPADRHWWCCFAHYGMDNGKTFLAKMDDDFKELQRWTFPARVVADWDKMSASGGLWDGDTLLVSHHHFKVLYRLRLPKEGSELEFAAAHAAPFPGQGIAIDPQVPGGLVGIDRTRAAILFATKD